MASEAELIEPSKKQLQQMEKIVADFQNKYKEELNGKQHFTKKLEDAIRNFDIKGFNNTLEQSKEKGFSVSAPSIKTKADARKAAVELKVKERLNNAFLKGDYTAFKQAIKQHGKEMERVGLGDSYHLSKEEFNETHDIMIRKEGHERVYEASVIVYPHNLRIIHSDVFHVYNKLYSVALGLNTGNKNLAYPFSDFDTSFLKHLGRFKNRFYIEYDPERMKFLKEVVQGSKTNIRPLLSDAKAIPLKDNTVDVTILKGTYHRLAPRTAKEIVRITKPGGLFIVGARFSRTPPVTQLKSMGAKEVEIKVPDKIAQPLRAVHDGKPHLDLNILGYNPQTMFMKHSTWRIWRMPKHERAPAQHKPI